MCDEIPRKGLIEKVTHSKELKGAEGVNLWKSRERLSQMARAASAKALRQECIY